MSAGEACVQRVLMSLKMPAVGRITLYGMEGIGKTWAARRVADLAVQGSLFDTTIWVSLSAGSSPRQVQEMILEKLPIPASARGDSDDDGEEVHLEGARRTVRAALSGTKLLLILDDLWWTVDHLLDVIGFPHHGQAAVGPKVLVTTRSNSVLVTTHPDLRIEMAGLPFRRSVELFLETAGEGAGSQALYSLVHEVVERCRGIPLAIVLMGGALKGSTDASALKSKLELASSGLGQATRHVVLYHAAKLAHRLLPSDAARELSLKCALIDQRVDILTHGLTRYCAAFLDGTVEDGNVISIVGDPWEEGRAMVKELLNRRLLYEDGNGRVMMQNVVREVLIAIRWESNDNIYLRAGPEIKRSPGKRVWRRYGMIGLVDTAMEALPESPACPRLSTLLLSGNHLLTTIPEGFFSRMLHLGVLDLSDTSIGHLPSSFRHLPELRVLLLRRCVRLEEVANVDSPKLEVLDLSGATRLKSIAWGPSSPAPPSLAVLNLSETSIEELLFLAGLPYLRQLCLSGCRRLKSALQLSSLTKLELLDLSGTLLVDFPDGISELTQLKRLRLVGSKYTMVDWRMIHWLPERLNWDQSSGSDITIEPVQNGDDTASISANDPRVFSTLDRYSPLWKSCFTKFQFSVCHPDAAGDVSFLRKGFAFRDAYFKTRHFVNSERRERHLEISGAHGFPRCMEGVLCNSELVALNNVKFMKQLSDLGVADMRGMKECWIERCDQMETVLEDQEVEFLGAEGSLECLWVSNCTSLRRLFGEMGRGAGSFACLKHVSLDCCPSLVCVFPSAMRLQSLETLQIKFCDGLEEVFGEAVAGEDALPRLHTMRLWELPQLRYISDGVLPALKSLKVKQCPMLTKIPVGTSDMSPLARIEGDSWWWNNLKWDDRTIKSHVLFRRLGRF